MFQKFFSLLLIPIALGSYLNIPDNIDFDINYYNSSNCSKPFKTTSLKSLCYNSDINYGYPKCCQDLLSQISIFPNRSFNACFKAKIYDTNITHVSYNCATSNLHGLDKTESLAYFGMISIFLIAILVLVLLCCCCYRTCFYNNYSRI